MAHPKSLNGLRVRTKNHHIFLDSEKEIEKLRFETLNLFDSFNRKCRKNESKMEKEKCFPQLQHSE